MSTSRFNNNDPFADEYRREKLANIGDKKGFLKLYERDNSRIKNLNNKQLWDKMLAYEKDALSPMTIDRIKITSNLAINYLNLNNTKIKKVFDIGIGNGYIELQIQEKYSGITMFSGIDIAKSNLEKIRLQLHNFKGTIGKIEHFEVKKLKHNFDLVLALEVLEHIDVDRVFRVYEKIYTILSIKGHLIVSVPINENLKDKIDNNTNYSAHVRRYTPAIIKYELFLAGFKVINEVMLYAFSKNYRIKSFVAKLLPIRSPNLIILECIKQ